MNIYSIILIVALSTSALGGEPQMIPFHRPITPLDNLKFKINSVPILLNQYSQRLAEESAAGQEKDAHQKYSRDLQGLYINLLKAQEDFVNYVIIAKPTLTDEDTKLFKKLQKRKTEGWYKPNVKSEIGVNNLAEKLRSEYNELRSSRRGGESH